ncbi:MAG TPA: AbrB/MazE/SpoVT family DNA-binding domain-containing protein [Candidatus Ozemobacteraceae bacterium]|nr:AbrB/MazE/SpoVT family DNA-binding domain-containing protein [Candidatus Ozemobacteraceae bacterium]
MEAILDKFGRIVIPKEIRDALGLRPGSSFLIEEKNQGILLKPVEGTPHIKNEHGWLIFTGDLQADISNTINDVRKERFEHVSGMNK